MLTFRNPMLNRLVPELDMGHPDFDRLAILPVSANVTIMACTFGKLHLSGDVLSIFIIIFSQNDKFSMPFHTFISIAQFKGFQGNIDN